MPLCHMAHTDYLGEIYNSQITVSHPCAYEKRVENFLSPHLASVVLIG